MLEKKWFYPIFAPILVLMGWGVNMALRNTFSIPAGFQDGFIPNIYDILIALNDVSVSLCVNFVAGWLLAPPHKNNSGWVAWVVLWLLLIMLGAELVFKGMYMALSLNYDYWVYVARSLLPKHLQDVYLLFPLIGLFSGFLMGTAHWHWRQRRN